MPITGPDGITTKHMRSVSTRAQLTGRQCVREHQRRMLWWLRRCLPSRSIDGSCCDRFSTHTHTHTHTQGASKISLLDMSAMWRVSGSSQQMAVHKLVPTACKDQNLQTQIPCEIGRADPNGARHYYQTIHAAMGPSAS